MRDLHIGRRLGFILSTIHAGSALKLWHKLVARALQDEGAFFIFPGGKLVSKGSPEHFRNDVYSLVNSSNLDGLISWASSISGSVSVKEVEEFHRQFEPIPFVTIGQKVPNHACAEFDAYSGMKELVLHFIQTHGVRKIAFLRGPEAHTSAQNRLRGYKDALVESGIQFDGNLVTAPFSWYDGEMGARQLCEERALVPGKDFEALIAASDLMAFAAVNYFKQNGVRIPKDLLVGGFNDTEESRISVPSFSTVHMPHAELGIEGYEKISGILDGMLGVSDSNLAAYPVIRESCGCVHTKIWSSDLRTKIRSKEHFSQEVCRILRLKSESDDVRAVMTPLFAGDKSKFYDLFTQRVTEYFQNDGDLLNLFSILSLFRCVSCLEQDYIEKIVRHVTVLIPRIQERVLIKKQYKNEKTNEIISSLKNKLLSVFDRGKLFSVLKEYLHKIEINTVALVLYEDKSYSNYIGGYGVSGEIRTEEVRFPREMLVPERFSSDFEKGAFIVQPLFIEDRSYGYLICNYSDCQGIVYEDLRSSVSSVLQSIFLFEQMNDSKRIAEQAEFAKTEFFANVGSELCDPLRNISAKVQQVEKNIENGLLDRDILVEQLLFVRSQIDAQLEKTEMLVDLTRSQVDDLPMNKKLFDIRQVLPGGIAATLMHDFPLLFGDADRLKRAIQTIFDFADKPPYVSEKLDGLHIEFYSSRFDWQKPELLLAEKIILLQFGNIEKSDNYTEVTLPWPNLAGLPPETQNIENPQIYGLSEKLSKTSPDFETKYIFGDGVVISEIKNAILVWEPDLAPIDEWIKVYGLRRSDVLFRAPLICYSRNMIGHSFSDLLAQKIKTQRTAPVLFINAKHTHYGTWATDSNTVSISSMDEFENILCEITPALIVLESVDEKSLKKIRQNRKTVFIPVLIIPNTITSDDEVDILCSYPRAILCNRGVASSDAFNNRINAILAGDEILPPHTGALVKRAILYLNKNASQQIVRWKLADSVHVSEDYLTRIFHKEIGLSLWEYLNRYRIHIAIKMLLETNDTIYEIAEKTGFQDQAYFCRVFKKIHGSPPGKIRSKQ